MTDVTCAIIQKDGKVLSTQRSESMSLPLKWEFPGGKVEVGESKIACLHREVMEELHIKIDILQPLTPVVFDYKNRIIRLLPYLADYVSGDLFLTEHKDYEWLKQEELHSVDWAPADLPIVEEYLELVSKNKINN
jgi:8-oxo-dGTP diphosphatase